MGVPLLRDDDPENAGCCAARARQNVNFFTDHRVRCGSLWNGGGLEMDGGRRGLVDR